MDTYAIQNLGVGLGSLACILGYHYYWWYAVKTRPETTVYGLSRGARYIIYS